MVSQGLRCETHIQGGSPASALQAVEEFARGKSAADPEGEEKEDVERKAAPSPLNELEEGGSVEVKGKRAWSQEQPFACTRVQARVPCMRFAFGEAITTARKPTHSTPWLG